jgi:hypothetical protein
MTDYLLRFLLGGIIVSVFAVLGGIIRPKSLAGLFGAAPSIALCTLGLALMSDGAKYAAIEARSMIIGAIALMFYSIAVCQLMQRLRWHALSATSISLVGWMMVAVAGKLIILG